MMAQILFGLATLALSLTASAQTSSKTSAQVQPTPDHYNCQVIVIAPDLQGGSQTIQFRAIGPQTETHGGVVYTFPAGNTKVQIQANSRWRAITWTRNDMVIAAATHLRTNDSHESEVTIAFNPQNEEESVTLECKPLEE